MPTWILRKSVDCERISDPLSCTSPNCIARVLGLMTLEEQMAGLVAQNETVMNVVDGQRKIYRDQELVGYIVVLTNES